MAEYMRRVLTRLRFDFEAGDLRFGDKNSKLGDIPTLSLPAGHSCPFAKDCRSCAIRNPRKRHDIGDKRKFIIQDGKDTQFRCYTAIEEVLRKNVRNSRWFNFFLIQSAIQKGLPDTVMLIERSLPKAWGRPTRAHVAGDFFHQLYFDAWMEVARRHPDRLFYAYTKALPFWVKRLGSIPANFKLTASYGGTHDWMISAYGLKACRVVESIEEAQRLGLELDHDDSLAYSDKGNFALLIHGIQPKGRWARAWHKLRTAKISGYGVHKANLIAATAKTLSAFKFLGGVAKNEVLEKEEA